MSTKSNKSVRVPSLDDIAARKAKLEAEMKALDEKIEQARLATLKEIESKIEGLPEHFGVATLDDVSNLIAKFRRGILFQNKPNQIVGERAPRVSLTDEQKTALLNDRRAGMQYSTIAEKYGVSQPTVYNYCKEAGLVVPRGSKAEAPAPAEVPAETPTA